MNPKLLPEIQKLVPGYLRNRHNDLAELEKALAGGDFKTIKFIGHNIKGNAENYGFSSLTPIGRNLETAALASDRAGIRNCIDELSRFLAELST